MDYYIQTCYLWCKKPALYLTARKAQVTEKIIKLTQFMFQWFLGFSEFAEFSEFIESSAI